MTRHRSTRRRSARPRRTRLIAALAAVTVAFGGTLLATPAAAAETAATPAAAKKGPFPDVPADHLHVKNIKWMADNGVTKPIGGKYKPKDPVTNGAMMTFLFRIVNPGKAAPTCKTKPYADVPVNYVHCGAVQWAKSYKVLTVASSDWKFEPKKAVDRAQMAFYMFKAAHPNVMPDRCTSAPFDDIKASYPVCGPVQWAKDNKITSGVSKTKFGPGQLVNRGSMSSFLVRLYNYMHKS